MTSVSASVVPFFSERIGIETKRARIPRNMSTSAWLGMQTGRRGLAFGFWLSFLS